MAGGTRSYEMGRRLVRRGHEVHMITSDRTRSDAAWQTSYVEGMHVHWVGIPYANEMPFWRRLRAFTQFAAQATYRIMTIQADVVFATSTPLTVSCPALVKHIIGRLPMVFEVRDMWPKLPIAMGVLSHPVPIALARMLERITYRQAAEVVTLSPGMKRDIVTQGVDHEKIHVIPNGADIEAFGSAKETSIRDKYDWLQNRPLVVYTGTVGRIHGVSYIVEVAAYMQHMAPQVRFLIVGEGSELRRVKREAYQAGVLNKTLFMMPRIPKKEIASVLESASMAFSTVTSKKELWANSANKFFESLSSGTPIAINYGGWQANVLSTYDVGVRLPTKNVGTAAEKLMHCLNDQEWLDAAGHRARELAAQMFNYDNLAEHLESVLCQAVNINKR